MEKIINSHHSISEAIAQGFSNEIDDIQFYFKDQIEENRVKLQTTYNQEVMVKNPSIEGDFLIVTYTFSEPDSSNIENK